MKEIDLYTLLNIYIENAVDEIKEQEKGEITIAILKTDESFKFFISNSLIGCDSSPKQESFKMGRKISKEIISRYQNVEGFRGGCIFARVNGNNVHK